MILFGHILIVSVVPAQLKLKAFRWFSLACRITSLNLDLWWRAWLLWSVSLLTTARWSKVIWVDADLLICVVGDVRLQQVIHINTDLVLAHFHSVC